MDGDMRNWGYYEAHPTKQYEPSMKMSFQLLTNNMGDRKPGFVGPRDPPLISNTNGGFHSRDYMVANTPFPVDYLKEMREMRDPSPWMHSRERYFNGMHHSVPSQSHSFIVSSETPSTHHPMQMLRQAESSNEERMVRPEPPTTPVELNSGPLKKRSAGKSEKAPKTKKPKKAPSGPKEGGGSGSIQRAKSAKKTTEVVINGIDMDISSIPIPVCSCTGAPQQCYRWGSGGWQSACCTTGMSMYPLPMSSKRRGARIAGRKMSLGAFKKVLEKLAAEGYNFSNPIDLRTHWAKHGTNKFVTIR